MQPVLARARRILLGQEQLPDPQLFTKLADELERDPVQAESYLESDMVNLAQVRPVEK